MDTLVTLISMARFLYRLFWAIVLPIASAVFIYFILSNPIDKDTIGETIFFVLILLVGSYCAIISFKSFKTLKKEAQERLKSLK